MNERQRNRHFWIWVILGPLAIALVVAALLYRQQPAIAPADQSVGTDAQTTAPTGGER